MAVGAGHVRPGTPWPPPGARGGVTPLPAISISHNSPIAIILIKRQPHPFFWQAGLSFYALFSCFFIFPIVDHAVQPPAHKDKPGQGQASRTTSTSVPPRSSRTSGSQRASRNTPPTPATVILPQMAQCMANGHEHPAKFEAHAQNHQRADRTDHVGRDVERIAEPLCAEHKQEIRQPAGQCLAQRSHRFCGQAHGSAQAPERTHGARWWQT